MNPPICSCVSFSISCLQPGYRPCLSYNRRSFHSLDNQLKTLYVGLEHNETIVRVRGETQADL